MVLKILLSNIGVRERATWLCDTLYNVGKPLDLLLYILKALSSLCLDAPKACCKAKSSLLYMFPCVFDFLRPVLALYEGFYSLDSSRNLIAIHCTIQVSML